MRLCQSRAQLDLHDFIRAMMEISDTTYRRYLEYQRYVSWSDYDVQRLAAIHEIMEPLLPPIVDDFYDELARHPRAFRVITGGKEQVERLKVSMRDWLMELFAGSYDREYLARRWKVGQVHAEIGLEQVFTFTALARLRNGLTLALKAAWKGDPDELLLTVAAMNKLLDLDVAIIQDAYQHFHSGDAVDQT